MSAATPVHDVAIPAKAGTHSDLSTSRHSHECENPVTFARYPEYKDSGVEWLGEVPAPWGVCQLRRLLVCKLANGVFKRKNDFGEGTLLVNVFDAYRPDFKVDFSSLDRVRCDESELHTYAADEGDILFVRSSLKVEGIAVAVLITQPQEIAVFECHLIRARLRATSLLPRFASFLLSSNQYRDRLVSLAKVTTMTTIEQESLCSLPVLLPPIVEQTRIAVFLDRETAKIDALIAEQEKLIALLKEKRQALISHAVTKGLDPNAPMEDSGTEWLGQVPAHWDVARLGRIFRDVSDVGADDLPILSVSIHDGISDKELDETEMDRKVTRSEDRSKYKAVQPGDLAYNMMRAWQGGFGAVTVAGQVSPAYVVARPIGKVCTSFIEQLLRTPQAIEQMRRHSRGVTDFRLRLYWEEFKNLRVALPTLPEQQAILDAIAIETTKLDSLIGEAVGAIELLKERRAALISAAVTGKICVLDS